MRFFVVVLRSALVMEGIRRFSENESAYGSMGQLGCPPRRLAGVRSRLHVERYVCFGYLVFLVFLMLVWLL